MSAKTAVIIVKKLDRSYLHRTGRLLGKFHRWWNLRVQNFHACIILTSSDEGYLEQLVSSTGDAYRTADIHGVLQPIAETLGLSLGHASYQGTLLLAGRYPDR